MLDHLYMDCKLLRATTSKTRLLLQDEDSCSVTTIIITPFKLIELRVMISIRTSQTKIIMKFLPARLSVCRHRVPCKLHPHQAGELPHLFVRWTDNSSKNNGSSNDA